MAAKKNIINTPWKDRSAPEKLIIFALLGGGIYGIYRIGQNISDKAKYKAQVRQYERQMRLYQMQLEYALENNLTPPAPPLLSPPPVPDPGSRKVKTYVDKVYQKLHGVNVFDYPTVINKIIDFTDQEVKDADALFYKRYPNEGSLFQFISNEYAPAWLITGNPYDPALNKLTSLGLDN
jgi:hypothetical protein